MDKGLHEISFLKYGTLHDFACHPCAGAMLIFSVSFQFQYMYCRSSTFAEVNFRPFVQKCIRHQSGFHYDFPSRIASHSFLEKEDSQVILNGRSFNFKGISWEVKFIAPWRIIFATSWVVGQLQN